MNIKYKMGNQLSWAAMSVAIYIASMVLTFYPLVKLSVINQSQGSFVYRLSALVIYQFAISMRFKEDFDYLLTLSSTRKDIFQSHLLVALGFSAVLSGLIVLETLLVDHLNNVFGFHNITDPFHFFSPYSMEHLLPQFLFFFILCGFLSGLGLLLGSLFYRFGKKFTLAFWLIFSAIPIVIFPLLLWIFHLRGHLSESLSTMGEFLKNFDVWSGSLALFFLTIIFGVAAWLNIRRLPQK